MICRCPNCGAANSLDSLVSDAEAAEVLKMLLELDADIGKAAIRYIGLFRPGKSQLSWGRTAKLLNELLPMIKAQEAARDGVCFPAPAALPDTLVWGLLKKGKTTIGYDGQYFFDVDHPVFENHDGTGQNTPYSNLTTGTDNDAPTFYVVDDTKTLKPLIFQNRTETEFETKFDPSKSDRVFMEDEYLYGSRRRCNAGFGLWQLMHMAEKTALTRENLAKIIVQMQKTKADGG